MYWEIQPEVPGHLNDQSIIDRSVHPPIVSSVHFEFDGWMGDELITAFPIFLVGPLALEKIRAAELGGYLVEDTEITFSEDYREMENVPPVLPEPKNFRWFKITGQVREDDFGVNEEHNLIVSNRALEVLRPFISHADVSSGEAS